MVNKKRRKQVRDLVGLSITTSVGAQAIEGVGGSAAPLASVSRFTPIMGTLVGAGMVTDSVGLLSKKKRRRKR